MFIISYSKLKYFFEVLQYTKIEIWTSIIFGEPCGVVMGAPRYICFYGILPSHHLYFYFLILLTTRIKFKKSRKTVFRTILFRNENYVKGLYS